MPTHLEQPSTALSQFSTAPALGLQLALHDGEQQGISPSQAMRNVRRNSALYTIPCTAIAGIGMALFIDSTRSHAPAIYPLTFGVIDTVSTFAALYFAEQARLAHAFCKIAQKNGDVAMRMSLNSFIRKVERKSPRKPNF